MKKKQDKIKKIFYKRDKERGVNNVFLWFVEEVGELSKALRRKDEKNTKEEIADCFAWLYSLCNVLDIDAQEAFEKKYGEVCLACGRCPCECVKK